MPTHYTQDELIAALEADDWETTDAIIATRPAWFEGTASPIYRAFWYAMVRRFDGLNARVDAEQARVAARCPTRETPLDACEAAREASATAADDLDIFQAGYERGYAVGWQHAQRETTKEET
jgi:hypothetical protein